MTSVKLINHSSSTADWNKAYLIIQILSMIVEAEVLQHDQARF